MSVIEACFHFGMAIGLALVGIGLFVFGHYRGSKVTAYDRNRLYQLDHSNYLRDQMMLSGDLRICCNGGDYECDDCCPHIGPDGPRLMVTD